MDYYVGDNPKMDLGCIMVVESIVVCRMSSYVWMGVEAQ